MLSHFKTSIVCLLAGIGLIMAAPGAFSQTTSTNHTEVATFGGGCFWCMEAQFKLVPGVKTVTSGFAGGHTAYPSYEDVCTGETGHAEVIQVEFDPAVISYEKLLEKFWYAHDPTTLNRQGNDTGTQYRSIILYRGAGQKAIAEKSEAEAQKDLTRPIVTQIVPFAQFYKAEDYHQDYFKNHPESGYCQMVIRPEVQKFKKKLEAELPANTHPSAP
jgi:peptide-methionine (S)-S-oxide reductase